MELASYSGSESRWDNEETSKGLRGAECLLPLPDEMDERRLGLESCLECFRDEEAASLSTEKEAAGRWCFEFGDGYEERKLRVGGSF